MAIHIDLFESTGGDRDSGRHTCIAHLAEVIRGNDAGQKVHYVRGPGAPRNSVIIETIERLTGNGMKQTIIQKYEHLATCTSPNDEYLAIGSSRGADIALSVAAILARVGIPARSADCKHIFDAFVAGKLEDPKTCQQVMEKYNCWKIKILALICFDTVVARGLPRSGILQYIPHRHEPEDYTNILAPVGDFLKINVGSLGELRAPYFVTLMHDAADGMQHDSTEPNTSPINMFFAGSHTDTIKGPLSLFPLIHVLFHLRGLGIALNLEVLDDIIARHSSGSIDEAFHTCLKADGSQSYKGIHRLTGTRERRLNQMAYPGYTANIQVHPSVHERGFGLTLKDKAVLGHRYVALQDGRGIWADTTASVSDAELTVPSQSQLVKLEAEWTDFENAVWRRTAH